MVDYSFTLENWRERYASGIPVSCFQKRRGEKGAGMKTAEGDLKDHALDSKDCGKLKTGPPLEILQLWIQRVM